MNFIERTSCPVCSSPASSNSLYSVPFSSEKIVNYLDSFYLPQGSVNHNYLANAQYELVKCNTCELVYQRYIPNDFLMGLLYEKWIDPNIILKKNVLNYSLQYFKKNAEELCTILEHLTKKSSTVKMLDFGMGWGHWCMMAQAFGCEVYGLELSKTRISYAKERGIKILKWEDLKSFTFDFINTEQVFEHIAQPKETIIYLAKSLKAEGIVKLSVPNGKDFNKVLSKMDWNAPKGSEYSLNMVAPLEHINCFNNKALIRLGSEASLQLTQPEYNVTLQRQKSTQTKEVKSLRQLLNSQKCILEELIKKVNQKLNPKAKINNLTPANSTKLFFKKV